MHLTIVCVNFFQDVDLNMNIISTKTLLIKTNHVLLLSVAKNVNENKHNIYSLKCITYHITVIIINNMHGGNVITSASGSNDNACAYRENLGELHSRQAKFCE